MKIFLKHTGLRIIGRLRKILIFLVFAFVTEDIRYLYQVNECIGGKLKDFLRTHRKQRGIYYMLHTMKDLQH